MPAKNRELLLAALDDDFYYMDELRRLYLRLVPDGDPEEINPYNLKEMGFAVLSRVALRNFSSMESYFVHLLTSEEILDIRELRRRFSYLSSFSSTLSALKNRLRVVEFEPNQLIRSDRLERAGVDRTVVDAFRDRVDQWTAPGAFFSIASLRRDGFEDDLFELGFSDWFYAGLLASDERFASGTMFSSQILRKGGGVITIRDFLESLVRERDSVDVYDLLSDLDSVYGCRAPDRADLLYKLRGTEVYHDPYLDRL